MDKLESLFQMQAKLNDFVFQKKGITGIDGSILSSDQLIQEGKSEEAIGPNTNTNKWLLNFLTAMDDESRELRDELLWKWWSKDTLNMQNIRVEIIDQLHFWISLAMVAGMDADKVYDIYVKKNEVNIKRQENDYSKASKTEDDNKNIQ
jgi:dimeric dUTPase (all-alpha-NTP-PPase superfamily)